jgi:hypothetical protein
MPYVTAQQGLLAVAEAAMPGVSASPRCSAACRPTTGWTGGAQGIGEGAANTMKLAADDVQTVVIPGCGHYCLEEAPEEVVAALTAFLARTGKASDMSVVVVTAFPVPEHRAEVIAAFETAIARVNGEPGVELYPLHAKGAALVGLRSALDGKLSSGPDAQVRVRTWPETRRRACCDRSPLPIIGFAGGLTHD